MHNFKHIGAPVLMGLLMLQGGCALQRDAFIVYVQPVGAPPNEVEALVNQLRREGYDASAIDVPTASVDRTTVIYGPDEQTHQQALRICRILWAQSIRGVALRAGTAVNHTYTGRHIGILLVERGGELPKGAAAAGCDG
jgi:hypothetical protein